MSKYCYVKNSKDPEGAIFNAIHLVHNSEWKTEGQGNGIDELQACRKLRLAKESKNLSAFKATKKGAFYKVELL